MPVMKTEGWVVIVGEGPQEIFGPMSYDEAKKMSERLKIRARQLDKLHLASTIAARAVSSPDTYNLEQIINIVN